ncbi:MAG: hypothetical protein ACOCW6_10550 [Spirochaetota bacterium]
MISVEKIDQDRFTVTVSEGGGVSKHTVTLTDDYLRKLTGGNVDKETLIGKSFEFLLEREPKESILSSFDLPVIGRYFPEYEGQIGRML